MFKWMAAAFVVFCCFLPVFILVWLILATVFAGLINGVMSNLLRPGGAILLIEPDFLPASVAEPEEMRTFWSGWLAWSRERGIDYHIGRTLAPRLAAYGLEEIGGAAETAVYNGGSPLAHYWRQTITELRGDLVQSAKLNDALIDAFLAYCADPELVDPDDRIYCRSRACTAWLTRDCFSETRSARSLAIRRRGR